MSDREITKEVTFPAVKVAQKMWDAYKNLKKQSGWLERKPEEKMVDFRSMDTLVADFISKYKVVSRCMIVNGEYNTKVFERYLAKLKTKGYTTQEDWAERESDYVKWLWMAYNPHQPQNHAQQVWTDTKKNLLDEENKFKNDYKEAEKKAKELSTQILKEHKKDIIAMFKKDPHMLHILKDAIANPLPKET